MKNKPTIWFLNHYATDMYYDGAGRHHCFGKYLIRAGYNVKIFCANTFHGNPGKNIDTNNLLFVERIGQDKVPYCFVKTTNYNGNSGNRLRNMVSFYENVKKTCKKKIKSGEKPDIILASSVHPLSLVAGIKIGKKYNIPCICEVRDLWPLSLVVFGYLKETSLATKILYYLEKWIYCRANILIFTFANGAQYIKDKGWDKKIDLNKVYSINNGIDLEGYNGKIENNIFHDPSLESDLFKVVYAGSMGPPNQVEIILDAAMELKEKGYDKIQFLLFGDGILKDSLQKKVLSDRIENVIMKGRVDNKYIPYILSKGDLNISSGRQSQLSKYGTSQNKLFEYLASGKPIVTCSPAIMTFLEENGYNIYDKKMSDWIINVYESNDEKYRELCEAAKRIAGNYSYEKLTNDLISIIKTMN